MYKCYNKPIPNDIDSEMTSLCNCFVLFIGTMWENWALLGSIFVCVPVLLLLRENYNRLTVDESSKQVPVDVDINEKQSET